MEAILPKSASLQDKDLMHAGLDATLGWLSCTCQASTGSILIARKERAGPHSAKPFRYTDCALYLRTQPVKLAGYPFAAILAASIAPAQAQPVIPGSTAFCLYEVPIDDSGKRRWINLGIVQYVEATAREVRIVYGAGAFGAGHEARIPVEDDEKARAVLEKLRRVAAACR